MVNKIPYKYLGIILIIGVLSTGAYAVMQYQKSQQKEALRQVTPDKLIITRPEDKLDNLPALTQTHTDQQKIKELYDELYMLPTSNRSGGCPIAYFSEYTLDFYKENKRILHAVLKPTGCSNVQLNNDEIKDALYKDGQAFILHVQQTTGLSNRDFYGTQNGKSLRE